VNSHSLEEIPPLSADGRLRLDLVGLLGADLLPNIDEYLLRRRAKEIRKIINNFPEKSPQTHTDQS